MDPELTPLDEETVRKILNACDDIRLKTFVSWLASSGWRAKESLSLYTQLDSLGLGQFAEFYIGHKLSEYWNKPENEKVARFKKAEPYLVQIAEAALINYKSSYKKRTDGTSKTYKILYAQGIIKKGIAVLGATTPK